MNPSIALCINVYNDAIALRGLLEKGASFFDNLFVVHAGPGGAKSTDGTIELCEQFGATIVFDDINKGFGVIRSRLIHDCGCEWAFIADADERFYPELPILRCIGTDRYPEHENPKLTVMKQKELINPGGNLRMMMQDRRIDAIKTIRRHWFDFTMTRPCENWEIRKDWQLRIVRNIPQIGYVLGTKMHEQLIDSRTNETPRHATAGVGGPFHDHFHMFFRKKYPGKKERNEENYQRLERGEPMIP